MNKLILLITTSLIYSQQLKVDGNLKVEGNIDASGNPISNVGTPQAATDALNLQTLNNMMTDNAQYEYKIIHVYSNWYNSYGGYMNAFRWLDLDQFSNINPNTTGQMENYNHINTFSEGINVLFNGGWVLESISGNNVSWWIFKRILEQE